MRVGNTFSDAEVEVMFQAMESAPAALRRRAGFQGAYSKVGRMRAACVKMRADVASLEATRKQAANG